MQALVGVGIGIAVLLAFGQMKAMPLVSAGAGRIIDEPTGATVVTDRAEWDFGEVGSGSVMEATFEIRNVGGSRLILRKTNGDCDCVCTGEAEIILEPGGHRTIVAKLDTNKVLGPVRIGVHYQTNDPRRPRLSLFCVADVIQGPLDR